MIKVKSDQQELFCQAYVENHGNASNAYEKAYPKCISGHRQAGQRLLTYVYIQERIAEIKAIRAKKAENSRKLVTQEMFAELAVCKENNDRTNTVRIIENLGKNCGWFEADNKQKQEQEQLSAEHKALLDDYEAYRQRQMLHKASG